MRIVIAVFYLVFFLYLYFGPNGLAHYHHAAVCCMPCCMLHGVLLRIWYAACYARHQALLGLSPCRKSVIATVPGTLRAQ